ncbi:MAG TPA: ROK family transcriptional regulator [Candidatus Sulfotelmatobacter sp.]|jgi:predicted NBD/HSP70 family sugar kinase
MRRTNFTNTEVASSETARAINRGVILNLIRRRQPISRAELARVSGLQRSTVSLITEQLIDEKWVLYGAVGRLPRGRRPTFLRLNDRRAILVADVRPIQITIAVADVNGHFLAQQSMPTRADARIAVKELATRIQKLIAGYPNLIFEGVGISLPGRFDESTQRLMFAPNLRWGECDLKGPIEKATGLRVELENAANACVLAEVWFGQADKIRDLVVVTVSEGVGTGIFANGQLARGLNGMAGEFGHVPLNPDGPLCTCGGRGCWEVYASNRAALRYYHESSATKDGPSFRDLLDLAGTENALAWRALEQMAHAVGKGIRMIVAGLAPEEILVVGEFTRFWRRLGPIIQAEIAQASFVGKPPRLRPSDDPSRARLRGAVALVLQKHFGPTAPGPQEREALEQHERVTRLM